MDTKPENVKCCSKCNIYKTEDMFNKKATNVCKDCNNETRRLKYKNNENHRLLLIQRASQFKHNKVILNQQLKAEEQEKIGLENKICKYCNVIKLKSRFRHNRLKCKDCERDDPLSTIIRRTRTRIIACLRKKDKHTIDYLGCNCSDYIKWILNNNVNYTFDNYGIEWHIDHVIPISKFDLNNEDQQLTAFNWRNTMPLSVKENLSKGNRIIKTQVEQHLKNLIEYHKENELDLPPKYIDLFAT